MQRMVHMGCRRRAIFSDNVVKDVVMQTHCRCDQGSVGMATHRRRRRGCTPPPPQTKVTIVGKKTFTIGNIWSGHFWYTNFCPPPPPPALFNTSLAVTSQSHRARDP